MFHFVPAAVPIVVVAFVTAYGIAVNLVALVYAVCVVVDIVAVFSEFYGFLLEVVDVLTDVVGVLVIVLLFFLMSLELLLMLLVLLLLLFEVFLLIMQAFLLMLLVYLSKFFDVRVYADGVLRDIVGFLVDIPFGVLADDVFCIGVVFATILSPTFESSCYRFD